MCERGKKRGQIGHQHKNKNHQKGLLAFTHLHKKKLSSCVMCKYLFISCVFSQKKNKHFLRCHLCVEELASFLNTHLSVMATCSSIAEPVLVFQLPDIDVLLGCEGLNMRTIPIPSPLFNVSYASGVEPTCRLCSLRRSSGS